MRSKERSCWSSFNFLYRKEHDCSKCDLCKTDKLPCQPCIKEQYQKLCKDWSSRNENIDKLVKYVRSPSVNTVLFLEWIPYERLKNITLLAKGRHDEISLATWMDGPVVRWLHDQQNWHRRGKMKVVLKTMNSGINSDFFAEIEAYFKCASPHLISYFGITRDLNKNYAIVMEYAEIGDLRQYLQYLKDNNLNLYWRQKLGILRSIVVGLETIHVAGMTHGDLHTGNILQFNDLLHPSRIANLGLSKGNEGEGGIIPYIAPEVSRGDLYTKAADIYSFAMILWEVGTAYANNTHDEKLIREIKDGKRLEIPTFIPECYANLIKDCWHEDPERRPTALEVKEKIIRWQSLLGCFPTIKSHNDKEASQFENADFEKSRRYRALTDYDDDDDDRELPDEFE